jgi:hypothetical protein
LDDWRAGLLLLVTAMAVKPPNSHSAFIKTPEQPYVWLRQDHRRCTSPCRTRQPGAQAGLPCSPGSRRPSAAYGCGRRTSESHATRHFSQRTDSTPDQSGRVIPVILAIPMFGDVGYGDGAATVPRNPARSAGVRQALSGCITATAGGADITDQTVADYNGRGHG